MIRIHGEFFDDNYVYGDLYYGDTLYGWEEIGDISQEEISILQKLKIINK